VLKTKPIVAAAATAAAITITVDTISTIILGIKEASMV
jgi:hypothetical protein